MKRERWIEIIAVIVVVLVALYLWIIRPPAYTWKDPTSAPTSTMPTPLPVPER